MDFKTVVLKTVSENTARDGNVYGLWIFQYFGDGKSLSVKVGTGDKKIKEDGSIWYSLKGFTPKDFETLKPHYQEFLEFSKNPPAYPMQEQSEPEIDEVPF